MASVENSPSLIQPTVSGALPATGQVGGVSGAPFKPIAMATETRSAIAGPVRQVPSGGDLLRIAAHHHLVRK